MKMTFLRPPLERLKRSCVHPLYIQELHWGNGCVIHLEAKPAKVRNNFLKMMFPINCLSPRRSGSSSLPIVKQIWLRVPRGSPAPRNGQQPASLPYTRVKKRDPSPTPLPQRPICLTCSGDVRHQSPLMIYKPPQLTQPKISRSE